MDNETVTKHTIQDLLYLQALPLELKVRLTKQRIREWISYYGEDGVYVSFSGGKDSTVLLHIVREEYPYVPAVFADTGLEYPELRNFVKTFKDVVWLKPKKNFRQVIEEYGYPFISKDVSQNVYEVRKYGKDRAVRTYSKFLPDSEYNKKYAGRYSQEKWAFLLRPDAPHISHMCCKVMKKAPFKEYEKITGRKPITAEMAEESRLRKSIWIKSGCNAFEAKRKTSKPMSFWTEQDILQYIVKNNIKIAAVYGDVVPCEEQIMGQMYMSQFIDAEFPLLRTTGCKRTGCVFCGFGCHLEKQGEGKFQMLKTTHPQIYDYVMRPAEKGGLNFKEVIDWLNENGNLHIRY